MKVKEVYEKKKLDYFDKQNKKNNENSGSRKTIYSSYDIPIEKNEPINIEDYNQKKKNEAYFWNFYTKNIFITRDDLGLKIILKKLSQCKEIVFNFFLINLDSVRKEMKLIHLEFSQSNIEIIIYHQFL